ncbi:MAG: hypothetical protein CMG21_00810 [Candidatus Marinimicrobia bacterium]|nr:hypothetical protein [Candidatus Neomarinimicrobiota bacterium]|tara:strand:- start:40 stop:540 length:501 start_codon:yes stop_codon:yes gene_type:complete
MSKDIESMISSYIEGEISNKNKIIFEKYMSENPRFFKKVNIIGNIINQFKNEKTLTPSENFIDNLHAKIPELSSDNFEFGIESENLKINKNILFSINWKHTLGISFMVVFVGIFFLNRTLISTDEINISNSNNLEENNILLSDSDTLKTNNMDFPIHQVKGSSTDK